MNLNDLRNLGAFVSPEPVKTSVEWNGNAFDVWVKRMSFGDVEAIYSGNDDASRSALMISSAIKLGDGTEPISYEDAYRLDVGLAAKLLEAINVTNGTAEAKKPN